MNEKDGIRRLFIPRRNSLGMEFTRRAGMEISAHLARMKPLGGTEAFSAFYPSFGEPDISGFLEETIRKGKEVCFPRYNGTIDGYEMAPVSNFGKDFMKGMFGVMEPLEKIPASTSGVLKNAPWLVPGVAFDKAGGRIGYGMGIYDRLLSDSAGLKIGICYDWQIIDRVPAGKRDVKMDFIVTESGIITCS